MQLLKVQQMHIKINMETTPYQRLEMLWLSKGLKNMSAFAEAVGLKPATISAIKQRGSQPSNNVMRAIQQAYPDINPEYILWGTGEMLKDRHLFSVSRLAGMSDSEKSGLASAGQELSDDARRFKEALGPLKQQGEAMGKVMQSILAPLQEQLAPFKEQLIVLAAVSESEEVKELKETVRQLREHNKLLTELLKAGGDLVKTAKSFLLDNQEAAVFMRVAA